ncbi:MAG: hypothetical protein UV34_C0010G0002 [Parcubacteria group bacterium GW2011_GWB1_42_6]|nr:MAG: hypothetical protein UV34_C0010G0002 [Parcubacteria group bacterium GW2011_GWB1_42_6]
MDQEIQNKFEEQNKKLEEIFRSVEKTRKYFLWTLILSLVFFFLPLIAIIFLLPRIFDAYTGAGLGL